MESKLAELSNLRIEIISKQEQKRNVWLHMYILFVSLFVLGLEVSHYLFLLTFVILIPYQEVINNMEWNVSRISAYIRTFFEKDNPDLNWESMNTQYESYLRYLDERVKGLSGFIRNAGSIHLGFLASAFFIGFTLKENITVHGEIFALDIVDIFFVLLSIGMFIITVCINQESRINHKPDLEPLMDGYREEVISRNSNSVREQVSPAEENENEGIQ